MKNELIGKKFRYESKYGLSDWVGVVNKVLVVWEIIKRGKKFYKTPKIQVQDKPFGAFYNIDEIFFIEDNPVVLGALKLLKDEC